MPKYEPPAGLSPHLLNSQEMIDACRARDFGTIFRLAKRAGVYPALIARRCEMTPSRATEILKGQREVENLRVVERIADGLRIPGRMLGLAQREWEPDEGVAPSVPASPSVMSLSADASPDSLRASWADGELPEPEFVVGLIESQLPQHYEGANYFGTPYSLPPVIRHVQTISRLLESSTGSPRRALLSTGSRVAEFLGWLHQDRGDFRSAEYWSDRSMEWAQEVGDGPLQAYILFRKSNQATARASGNRAVGLARAAQRIPALGPRLTALAAQQEAQGHALLRNPRAALAKFDEARSLAAEPDTAVGTVDISYCTPTYIEIQRANCWIDLGQPHRAVELLQAQLAALAPVYRNDRSVYLARLARAHVRAGDIEPGAEAAMTALAIVVHTRSARTVAELSLLATAVESRRSVPVVATFFERFDSVRDQLAA